MKCWIRFGTALLILALSAAATAQELKGRGGNIYGKVTDENGGPLPGVTITLTGVGAPRTATTGTQGEFRFVGLDPGTYAIKAELTGLQTVDRPNVAVSIGSNTELTIPMSVSGVTAAVTVSSEVPLLDSHKERAGTNFTQEELKTIPSSRDPWGILQQTPGVLTDNLITGSNNNGQQSVFTGKGTNFNSTAWNMDGISITDLAAAGGSPAYYDFDAFQEMQMTTGGSDPSIATAGVTINMVTKRGTNDIHGSGRIFLTPEETESTNIPDEALDQGITRTNRIDSVRDYGIEVGGPAWRDHIWLWGSFGRTDINTTTAGGGRDNTQLEDYSAKMNIQPIESNALTGFYFRGNKTKQGRSAGPTRPPETSWNQAGPSHIWKLDDSQVFGSNVIVSAAYAYTLIPFSLTPQGGLDAQMYRDAANVWHGSFYFDDNYRPQHQIQGTLTTFFNTGSIGHEVKFGAAKVDFRSGHTREIPGDGVWGYERIIASHDPDFPLTANITRNVQEGQDLTNVGGFLGDTLTTNNLTLNLGLRYDVGYGENRPSIVAANEAFPDLLPALNYPGGDEEFRFKSWQPRIGASYAIGAQKTTLLRASYSRFADGVATSLVGITNPTGLQASTTGLPTAQFSWNDLNHDHNVQRNELCLTCPVNPQGYDPNNPGSAFSVNRIDPDLKAPKTDEFMIGVDHQILPEFVVGLSYTYRERKDTIWNCPIALDNSENCLNSSDFALFNNGEQGFDNQGNPIGLTGPLYYIPALTADDPLYNAAIARNYSYGLFETNRPDYETHYSGIELQLNKRLSNRWMAHASVTYADWEQKVSSVAGGCLDPTNQVGSFQGVFEGAQGRGNSCADGDIAYDYNGTTYINAKWSFNISGMYQLPLNFSIAGSFFGRQGYPVPYFVADDPGDGWGQRTIALDAADDHRLNDVYQLDLSAQKVLPIAQKVEVTLAVDVFNVFNSNEILFRNYDATGPVGTVGDILTIQNPRVFRFGARVSF
jgi:Carboxypeptidase regulatory-like domain